jgi:Cys-tRNA(Pro)/Cys-tRNA(Cys) deacylase
MNKTNAMRILETAHILFKCYEYNPGTSVDACSIAVFLKKAPEEVFKTLVTITPAHEHFVFVIPSNHELDLKKAARAAGVKSLEMIPLKALLPTTGYIHGGCSPVGMKKQFKTFIDSHAEQLQTFCISGGKIGLTLELSPQELSKFCQAPFADLTA